LNLYASRGGIDYPNEYLQRVTANSLIDNQGNRDFLEKNSMIYGHNIAHIQSNVDGLNIALNEIYPTEEDSKKYFKFHMENLEAGNVRLLDFSSLKGEVRPGVSSEELEGVLCKYSFIENNSKEITKKNIEDFFIDGELRSGYSQNPPDYIEVYVRGEKQLFEVDDRRVSEEVLQDLYFINNATFNRGLDVAKFLLEKADIAVVPGRCSLVSDEDDMTVRIVLSAPQSEITRGFDRICKAFRGISLEEILEQEIKGATRIQSLARGYLIRKEGMLGDLRTAEGVEDKEVGQVYEVIAEAEAAGGSCGNSPVSTLDRVAPNNIPFVGAWTKKGESSGLTVRANKVCNKLMDITRNTFVESETFSSGSNSSFADTAPSTSPSTLSTAESSSLVQQLKGPTIG
jgi:hypothetical protein